MQRINQLEGKLALEEPLNCETSKDGSGIHGQPPSTTSRRIRSASARNGSTPNPSPALNASEGGRRAFGSGEQSPILSQRNSGRERRDLSRPVVGANQSGSVSLHVQDSVDLQTIGHETPQENDEPYFYGESSNATLMQEVHDIISPTAQVDPSSNTDPSRGEPSIYSAPDSYMRREESIRTLHSNYLSVGSQINNFDLPPRSLADHLLDSYFNHVYILYPFLHRPTFEAAYEKLWAPANLRDVDGSGGGLNTFSGAGLGNFLDSGPESRVFYGGINAIFALSCQFSDLPIPKAMVAAKAYLERAMALLVHAELLDYPSISLVQVLLLLCLHLQSTPLRNRLWNIIGLAFRMAQGLGLHVEDGEGYGNRKTKSVLEIGMRRRTWYSCVMLDM